MLKYVLMRIVWLFFILMVVMTVLFFALGFVETRRLDVTLLERIIMIHADYRRYLFVIATEWDWGVTKYNWPVWDELLRRSGFTIRLNAIALVFYTVFGFVFGILGALYKGRLFDRIIGLFILVFSSVPAFVMVLMLILVFGYTLEWLPPQDAFTGGWWMEVKKLIIPVLSISALPLARFTRVIRGEMIEAFYSDYILLLKTKGLNTRKIITHHLIKDCSVPLLPQVLPMVIYTIVGSFIVESVYGTSGMSRWLFNSLFSFSGGSAFVNVNPPSVMMIGVFLTFITLVIGLIVDILYAVLDPRIRLGSKKASL